jgi:hypothetical protein
MVLFYGEVMSILFHPSWLVAFLTLRPRWQASVLRQNSAFANSFGVRRRGVLSACRTMDVLISGLIYRHELILAGSD